MTTKDFVAITRIFRDVLDVTKEPAGQRALADAIEGLAEYCAESNERFDGTDSTNLAE